MSTAEKIKGKAKQLVAEVIGDGKLADEGRHQQKQDENPGNQSPPDRAGKST